MQEMYKITEVFFNRERYTKSVGVFSFNLRKKYRAVYLQRSVIKKK